MKIQIGFVMIGALLLAACSSEPASVVCGKDFIKSRAAIVDTASVFRFSDPIVIQFRYGKNFDFPQLKWSISDANGKIIASKTSKVNEKEGSYTILSVSYRGGYMSASEFLRSESDGSYTIRFSAGDSLLAQKQIKLIRNSENGNGAK